MSWTRTQNYSIPRSVIFCDNEDIPEPPKKFLYFVTHAVIWSPFYWHKLLRNNNSVRGCISRCVFELWPKYNYSQYVACTCIPFTDGRLGLCYTVFIRIITIPYVVVVIIINAVNIIILVVYLSHTLDLQSVRNVL